MILEVNDLYLSNLKPSCLTLESEFHIWRILEWIALPFSRGSSQPKDWTQASHIAAEPQEKPKNTGMSSLSLLQGIILTKESNRGLLHCRQKLFFTYIHSFYTYIHSFFFICSGFCHTLKWNSHGFTCVPHPDPRSHLPLHPLPLGFPSAPGPSACLMHPTWAGDLFHPR